MPWLITACIITFAVSFALGSYFEVWLENDRKTLVRPTRKVREEINRNELMSLENRTFAKMCNKAGSNDKEFWMLKGEMKAYKEVRRRML